MGDEPRQTRFTHTRATTDRARKLRQETSKTEARLWLALRNQQLGASFRRQHPIGPYFADYCCVALKLVIEIDGPMHDAGRDRQRDRFLGGAGFHVMRFAVQEVDETFDQVVEAIWRRVGELKLERDGWES